MSARDDFPLGFPEDFAHYDEAMDEIDALRARVVVAEEALVVAYEDADRLAAELSAHTGLMRPSGHTAPCICLYCSSVGALSAHSAAVSSRPKATQ